MLALHEAATGGEELSYTELTRRTGLSAGHITLGLGALIRDGAIRPLVRGDTWLRAERDTPLSGEVLERWAAETAEMRLLAMARVAEAREFAASQRCRREGLSDALGYPLSDNECNCDRCRREAPVRVSTRIPGGYPIRTDGFRGWALALIGRPGGARAGQDPARLLAALRTRGDEGCGRRLAFAMHRRVKTSRTFRDCDVIVPIPEASGEARRAPAELLAHEIGRLSVIPVAMALRCADAGPTEDRPAIEVTSPELVEGSTVLLVDDVFDTGEAMHEAAAKLVRAGALDVRLLTAVRTSVAWRRRP
ncbi:MAG: hypothetical protein GF393_11025 [Armatimonadia bacterium]|nr:hypothetical protein [Armatimonadia bacterium]